MREGITHNSLSPVCSFAHPEDTFSGPSYKQQWSWSWKYRPQWHVGFTALVETFREWKLDTDNELQHVLQLIWAGMSKPWRSLNVLSVVMFYLLDFKNSDHKKVGGQQVRRQQNSISTSAENNIMFHHHLCFCHHVVFNFTANLRHV